MKDEPQYPEIGVRLHAVRAAFSVGDHETKATWAGRHGFNPTQYHNWESGFRRIPVECAAKLCDLYGLTLDFVYRGKLDGLSQTALKAVSANMPV